MYVVGVMLCVRVCVQDDVPVVSSSECVRADPRLELTHTCNKYSEEADVTHAFLYPPGLNLTHTHVCRFVTVKSGICVVLNVVFVSTDFSVTAESRYEASLITNTVPMYPAFKRE